MEFFDDRAMYGPVIEGLKKVLDAGSKDCLSHLTADGVSKIIWFYRYFHRHHHRFDCLEGTASKGSCGTDNSLLKCSLGVDDSSSSKCKVNRGFSTFEGVIPTLQSVQRPVRADYLWDYGEGTTEFLRQLFEERRRDGKVGRNITPWDVLPKIDQDGRLRVAHVSDECGGEGGKGGVRGKASERSSEARRGEREALID